MLAPLLSNIFINDIFLVVEKSDICSFADDNILFSHGSLSWFLSNLEDMKIFFIGSKLTQINLNELIKANPGKVQCIVLGKKNRLKYSLKIGSIIVKVSVEIQLLGITIDSLKL